MEESLNKQIRETISETSDEELKMMLNASAGQFTPFALDAAREELSRRAQMKATQISQVPGDVPCATFGSDKRADCYIEIWSDKNFGGEYLRIDGPVELQVMNFEKLDWGDSISSLRVGPGAFVLVYADEGFTGSMTSFGPSQEVANLDELKFDDEIDSMRLVNSLKVFDALRMDNRKNPAADLLTRKRRLKRRKR
jgi:hypothetical protein